jgi:hypothetical protein
VGIKILFEGGFYGCIIFLFLCRTMMIFLSVVCAFIGVVLIVICGGIKINLFHRGVIKEVRVMTLKEINEYIKDTQNPADKRDLRMLRNWHYIALVFFISSIILFLSWIIPFLKQSQLKRGIPN